MACHKLHWSIVLTLFLIKHKQTLIINEDFEVASFSEWIIGLIYTLTANKIDEVLPLKYWLYNFS